MVTRKKPEVKKLNTSKEVQSGSKKIRAERKLGPNPCVDVGQIPYMSMSGSSILSDIGIKTSDQLIGCDIYAIYDNIVKKYPKMNAAGKQNLINALRLGQDYANGQECQPVCELEKLLIEIPGLSTTAGRIMLKVYGTTAQILDVLRIDKGQKGISGAELVWHIYDDIFAKTDLSSREAMLLHVGITRAVYRVNESSLIPGPGPATGRTPPA